MSDEITKRTQFWVYVGNRIMGRKSELNSVWHEIDESGKISDQAHVFDAKKRRGLTKIARPYVGGVYQVTTTPDNSSVYLSGTDAPKYLRRWENDDEIAEWTLQHDAAMAIMHAAKREEKELSDDVLRQMLQPVIRAYRHESSLGRYVILARVIATIQRGTLDSIG